MLAYRSNCAMKSLLIICCTKHKKAQTKLYESLQGVPVNEVKRIYHENNVTGLPEIYNRYITKKIAKKHDIVLFVHDDVYIDDYKLRGKLYNAMKQFDIVGLAGCLKQVVKKPVLWHLMSTRENWRVYVHHPRPGKDGIVCTSFGYTPARVAIIDGLFMAVNLKRALEVDWRFNENFEFHHYDISSCFDANNKKLKIGTAPIHVIHSSPGLATVDDMQFKKSEDIFLKLYSNE